MVRLPQPGGDAGNWGDILNDYLSQVHNGDGTLKTGIVQTANLAVDAVNSAALANSSVSSTTLAVTGGVDGQVLTKDSTKSGGLSWSSAADGGTTTLGGDLSGTAANATIVAGAVDTTKLANGAVTSAKIADGTITSTDLSTALMTTINGKTDTSSLSAVATSGSYADLINKPTIPAQFAPVAGTNVTLTGTYPNVTISASGTAGVTNLSMSTSATDVTIASDTGTDATIAAATSSAAGVLSGADKTKLDGISTGATANQTNAYLLDRENHTGSQAISTVASLQSSLDAKLDVSKLGVASGAASLDTGGKVPSAQLPTFDKTTVGLGNVDNTSDANKPVSTAMQTALNLKFNASNLDTDSTLTANSDTKVASQKATKTYVDTRLATKADATAVGAKVLLINNAASLPAGTPAGVVVVVKA